MSLRLYVARLRLMLRVYSLQCGLLSFLSFVCLLLYACFACVRVCVCFCLLQY